MSNPAFVLTCAVYVPPSLVLAFPFLPFPLPPLLFVRRRGAYVALHCAVLTCVPAAAAAFPFTYSIVYLSLYSLVRRKREGKRQSVTSVQCAQDCFLGSASLKSAAFSLQVKKYRTVRELCVCALRGKRPGGRFLDAAVARVPPGWVERKSLW